MRFRRTPIELQGEANECGLACLAMVVGRTDLTCDLVGLRRKYPQFSRGATMKELLQIGAQFGLTGRGLRIEPRHIHQLRQPAILHWNLDHFVVLVRVRGKGCVIHDPARGRLLCTWDELDKHFTGVALELWPIGKGIGDEAGSAHGDREVASADSPQKPARLRLSDLWGIVKTSRQDVVWVLALAVFGQILLMLSPLHLQWLVDEALATSDAHLIGILSGAFAGVLVLRSLTEWLRGTVVVHLSYAMSYQLTDRLLAHLLALPTQWFEHRRVGDIAHRFGSLGPVQTFMAEGMTAIVVDALVAGLSLILMFAYAPQFAVFVLVAHLVYVAFYVALLPRLKHLAMGEVNAQAAAESHVLESVRAY